MPLRRTSEIRISPIAGSIKMSPFAGIPLWWWLTMDREIVFHEPLSEIYHGRFGRTLGIVVARTDPFLLQGQDLQRHRPDLLKRDWTVLADGKPRQFAGDTGLDDVVLAPRLADVNAEAALGKFWDVGCHGSNALHVERAY